MCDKVRQGEGGSKLAKNSVTYFMDGPLVVADKILANNIDVLVVCESRYRPSTDVAPCRSSLPGFSFVDCPRPGTQDTDRNWGGLVIYLRATLRTKKIAINSQATTFEALATTVATCRGPLVILAVYRPGSVQPTTAFFDEFAVVLEQFAL